MRRIPLSLGKYALVSDCDYKYLMQWKWSYLPLGYAVRVRKAKGRQKAFEMILMHREVASRMGEAIEGLEVDHKDTKDPCNGLNNCRSNLRVATRAQNGSNRGPQSNNTTGAIGVTRCGRRYRAYLVYMGKQYHCGCFDTVEEAASARDAKAVELHGEFAYLNDTGVPYTDPRGSNCRNSSGFHGVYLDKRRGRWVAEICVQGKRVHLKSWKTKEEAAKAYNEAAKKYFGPKAYQNKVPV